MQVSASIRAGVQPGRTRLFGLIVAVAAVIAVGAWALASHVFGAGPPVGRSATVRAPVLVSLTPHERRYVEGIMALSPAQIAAAFATQWLAPW
jgi:hypothetical protein